MISPFRKTTRVLTKVFLCFFLQWNKASNQEFWPQNKSCQNKQRWARRGYATNGPGPCEIQGSPFLQRKSFKKKPHDYWPYLTIANLWYLPCRKLLVGILNISFIVPPWEQQMELSNYPTNCTSNFLQFLGEDLHLVIFAPWFFLGPREKKGHQKCPANADVKSWHFIYNVNICQCSIYRISVRGEHVSDVGGFSTFWHRRDWSCLEAPLRIQDWAFLWLETETSR